MKLAAIAFTDRGRRWEDTFGIPVARGISAAEWTKEHFFKEDVLLFIGACGIAVRSIAPYLKGKTEDPAVLVMDEEGRYVIPILSGHIGGANDAAKQIAEKTGGVPVLTTATDVRGMTALDSWAMQNDMAIENPAMIAPVTAGLLSSGQIGVMITERAIKPPYPSTLILRPRTLVLGVGCRKEEDPQRFETNALKFLEHCGVSLLSVRALASIDLKKEEPALCLFCEKYGLPLWCYSAAELAAVQGVFAHSDFVEKTTGVGCVCERASVLKGGRLLMGKTVMDGATFALAGEEDI